MIFKQTMVRNEARGFTFIEILVVVGITVMLGAVTIPNYLNHKQQIAVDSEADRVLAFVRDAISKAKSQEGGETWAVEFVDDGDNDYYQLRKGGAEGTPVNKTYLSSGIEFADGTTASSTVLRGGPNVQILPTADSVLEVHLQTKNGNFTSLVSMDALGRVARSTLVEPCEPVVNGGWSATWVNSGACGQYQSCKQKQIKYCNNPEPACGGLDCPTGEGEQYIDCGLVNGGWTDWSPCIDGWESRTCTNPIPACGGTDCSGLDGGDTTRVCTAQGLPDSVFHFIKIECSSWADITGNADADYFDITGGQYVNFTNYPSFPVPYSLKPVSPSEIPGQCRGADGWSFKLSVNQNLLKKVSNIGPTDNSGEATTSFSQLTSAQQGCLLTDGQLWVGENLFSKPDDAEFAAIRCYTDALNGDNLEFIKLGRDRTSWPNDIYCIAYSVLE